MTIARRRPNRIAAIAPALNPPELGVPAPGLGVSVPLGDAPAPESVTPVDRLRRCTFRRIDQVATPPGRTRSNGYEVMCLYGEADEPMNLGDIEAARPICNACTASGIFRPDED